MKSHGKRGVVIGAYTSQPIGNFVRSSIDHHMKEVKKVKCYLDYCDDTVGLARTKAEAWAMVNEYERLSSQLGFVVKSSIIVAPIAHLEHGTKAKKKKRRRQRSRRRPKD